jgi:hypothetical protein
MPRRIIFNGHSYEKSLVIGNHDHIQLVAKGSFDLEGLIYCPKFSLELILQGEGALKLHGVCKRLVIKRVTGNIVMEMGAVRIQELSSVDLGGSSVLRMSTPKLVLEKNVHESAEIFFDGKKQRIKQSLRQDLLNGNDTEESANWYQYAARRAG